MITRLTRRLDARHFVYVWADGIHFNVRLDEERLCVLVSMGVGPEDDRGVEGAFHIAHGFELEADGTKELVAITDGYRESTESWADLLRDLKRRGYVGPGAGCR